MQSIAQLASTATAINKGSEFPTPQETKRKLFLVRPRTDEDKVWYSRLLRQTQHSRLTDKAVYERLVYYGSLNPEREAFASVGRMAREALVSERTAQYALRRLEAAGLSECITRKGGRVTARYRVLDPTDCAPGVQELRPRGATDAPEGLSRSKEGKEGPDQDHKPFFGVDEAKSKGGIPARYGRQTQESLFSHDLTDVPFQEQNTATPTFKRPQQVGMLFALQKKLGYEANNEQAKVFDDLDQSDKKRILDRLEAEELAERPIRWARLTPNPARPGCQHRTKYRTPLKKRSQREPPVVSCLARVPIQNENSMSARSVMANDDRSALPLARRTTCTGGA